MNILDLWNWEVNSETAGHADGGNSSCRRSILETRADSVVCADGSRSNPCTCPDKTGISLPVKVWTYNGGQAQITSGGTLANDDVWSDPSEASSVIEVDAADVSSTEALPVLCWVGN